MTVCALFPQVTKLKNKSGLKLLAQIVAETTCPGGAELVFVVCFQLWWPLAPSCRPGWAWRPSAAPHPPQPAHPSGALPGPGHRAGPGEICLSGAHLPCLAAASHSWYLPLGAQVSPHGSLAHA